jgi:hypothetical protein
VKSFYEIALKHRLKGARVKVVVLTRNRDRPCKVHPLPLGQEGNLQTLVANTHFTFSALFSEGERPGPQYNEPLLSKLS